MLVISNFAASPLSHRTAVKFSDRKLKCESIFGVNLRISRLYKNDTFHVSRLALGQSSGVAKLTSVCMALVDERLALDKDVAEPSGVLAYDLVQGAPVRWSSVMDKSISDPPTAVLLHGILGSRKNWGFLAEIWGY